jgi:multidrug efflux system outer membrane protein
MMRGKANRSPAAVGVSLAVALLLTACAPLPHATPPEAAVALPAQWSEGAAHPDTPPDTREGVRDGASTLSQGWWRQWGDARLDALVEQALQRNADVLVAMARVEEARAQWSATDAARSPSVNLTTGGQVGRSLGAFGPTQTRSLQPGLQAAWELDLWGRLAQQSQAAAQRWQASQADRDAVTLAVAATTVQSYIGLCALQAQLAITEATAQSRARALQLAQDQARVGYISQLQLTQAEAEHQGVLQQVAQLHYQLRRQQNALQVLVGEAATPTAAALPPEGALATMQMPPVPQSLPSDLLERRPDIARAQYQLAATDAALAAQRAAFMPQVGLSANVGSLLINALDYNPLTVWSLGGSLLAPLFNGARLDAQYDAATAQRNQAAHAYRGVVLAAFADVENALTGTVRLAEQMAHARQRRDVLERSLRFAHDRYEAGYASYLEELDAQRNLYQAQLEVVRLRQSELENRVALYKALGGGWSSEAVRKISG